jgi:putative phage-type endonuclease
MILNYHNREAWLEGRSDGIGGSEAACIVGMNPWKTRTDLFLEKTRLEPNTESKPDNSSMKFGRTMEPVLTDLFAKLTSNLSVEHNEYNVHVNSKYPFIRYTPDALYTDKDGHTGVLEIKTTTISQNNPISRWVGQIPDHYLIQILHGFLANPEWRTASWLAYLIRRDESGVFGEIRQGHYVREDVAKPLADLLEAEKEFWQEVENARKEKNAVT